MNLMNLSSREYKILAKLFEALANTDKSNFCGKDLQITFDEDRRDVYFCDENNTIYDFSAYGTKIEEVTRIF